MGETMKPEAAPDPSQAGRLVPRAALKGRVDSFLLKRMDGHRPEFIVREVTPRLTWNRLDLAIKLFYLEQSELGRSAFAEELYDAHIHAFSLGDFREPGNESKSDAASFRRAFRDILDGLRRTGFDPARSLIPAASDGSFINGGHRAACALFLGHKVHVVETGLPPVRYDFRFFRSRGMDEDLLEAAIVKFAERDTATRVALVWPGAGGSSEIEMHLKPLVYKRQVHLSARGIANLRTSLGVDSSGPIPERVEEAAIKAGPFVHVFQVSEGDHGPAWEANLRELALKGRDVVHLPASREQGLDIARTFLNERSVRFLNAASPERFPETAALTDEFRDSLGHAGVPREEAILGPGMVLAAFGARKSTGVDVMSRVPIKVADVSIGITPTPSPDDLRDILLDPRRHFHAWGLKFLSVGEALKAVRRDPAPAAEDLRLLSALLPQAEPQPGARKLLGTGRLLYARARRSAIRTLAGMGLREQAIAVYRMMKGRRR